MSAALVASVRRNLPVAVDLREAYGIDLPAILAALTEAEALRAQIVAGQAREVALREALTEVQWGPEPRTKDSECPYCLQNHRSGHDAPCAVGAALSTPPGSDAALRAIVEKAAGMGMSCGYSRCCSKLEERRSDADRDDIVSRLLGERAEGSET